MAVDKYELFMRVVELGSLTRAAEELGVSQPAVSHAIAALEQEFGFALLRRARRGVVLTPEGRLILPALRGVMSANEQLSQIASDIRGLDCGNVSIATFSSVGVHWLPGIIDSFQRACPRVRLRLMSGDYHDVERWLTDGSADVGFVTLPTELKGELFPLAADRLLAVLPAGHPLAGGERYPTEQLGREDFIGLLETSDRDARGVLEAAGVDVHIKYTTKDDYAVIAMVEQGLGVSIMPELLLRNCSARVRLLELDPPASRTIALCLPAADRAGPAVRRFAEHVKMWVAGAGNGGVAN